MIDDETIHPLRRYAPRPTCLRGTVAGAMFYYNYPPVDGIKLALIKLPPIYESVVILVIFAEVLRKKCQKIGQFSLE